MRILKIKATGAGEVSPAASGSGFLGIGCGGPSNENDHNEEKGIESNPRISPEPCFCFRIADCWLGFLRNKAKLGGRIEETVSTDFTDGTDGVLEIDATLQPLASVKSAQSVDRVPSDQAVKNEPTAGPCL